MLLLGYAGALRRAELVAIEREHVAFTTEGLRLLIPRAKGDPEGEGAGLGIPKGARRETCPVRALEGLARGVALRLRAGVPQDRRLGRHRGARAAPRRGAPDPAQAGRGAGLTVASAERLSPHGLRAGFVTEAYRAGARDEQIMDHTRHRDLNTMRGYVRRAKLVTESPVKLLDL